MQQSQPSNVFIINILKFLGNSCSPDRYEYTKIKNMLIYLYNIIICYFKPTLILVISLNYLHYQYNTKNFFLTTKILLNSNVMLLNKIFKFWSIIFYKLENSS